MSKITPFLWFNDNAEQAMDFYASIFKDATITAKNMGPDGKLFTGSLTLQGQELLVLNGGPQFTFNESISFFVNCADQDEVDYFWQKLTDGGQESQCGWLKDKFGLSWQIVPQQLGQLTSNPDPVVSGRVIQAMLKMNKIIIADLQAAHDQA